MLGIRNVRIETISHGPIEEGSILIDDGKIVGLGKDLDLSKCSRIIDGNGRIVTPGLVDSHTHLGIVEAGVGSEGKDSNEATKPVNPLCQVRDGINMRDKSFQTYRKAGITTAGVFPGSQNIIGGTCLALKCKGTIVDEAILKDPIGIKVAIGENPKVAYGNKKKSPATRMGNAALLRGALLKAKEYADKVGDLDDNKRDREAEALVPVIKGEIPLIVHCHRHDDIATVIRICKEFNVKYVLEHVTDGHLLKDIIKRENIHCAVGPTLFYGSKVENKDRDFRTSLVFDREDIPFCFMTDHPIVDGRNLILTASVATQWGMSDENALRAITLSPAQHIGVDDRVGSIEIGKDGDIVIWSGNPLELTTFVDMTIIDGEIVYEREGK